MQADPTVTAMDLSDALVAATDVDRIDAFAFARGILPAFGLVRVLFSSSEVDTCCKLMILFELSRASGRSDIARIRSLVSYLEPERVDALVRPLREGGWLDLRDTDSTYSLAPAAMNLLAVLHAADLGGLESANAMARAARNAEFAAQIGGSGEAASYLLDQLLVILEAQVDDAAAILRRGRPRELIAWSRRRHTHQLTTIREVLGSLQVRLDEASREFARVVRLHEAMQEIIRQHAGIHERLRDWNVERLFASDAGWSIPELIEAVVGADDVTLLRAPSEGGVQSRQLPRDLTTAEVRDRFHGARRKLQRDRATFRYAPPTAVEIEPHEAAGLDPAASLRKRLTLALVGREPGDAPVELEDWVEESEFSAIAWDITVLSRLQAVAPGEGTRIELDDGRVCRLRLSTDHAAGVHPDEVLDHLVAAGALRRLEGGWFARVQVELLAGEEGGIDG